MTPMFRQYRALKGEHADAILLFRMGDFYEMFYEDARDASRILELTLTARGKGTAHAAPMCGFPHHQIDAYTAKLVRAGRRVAVCDQVEDPRKAKGLVRREVVRVITPGTITDPEQLDANEPNWIASIAAPGGRTGAAFLEVSTGAFVAWSAPDPGEGDAWRALLERLQTFAPREIVHPEDLALDDERRRELSVRALLTPSNPFAFAPQAAADTLARHFDVAGLEGRRPRALRRPDERQSSAS